MAGKQQYEVIRPFRRTNPRTGVVTSFEVGDTYGGAVDKPYLLGPEGPDGKGPLIADKSLPPVDAEQSSSAPASDDSSKEK